ncbi:unnamed protein product [Amoebophrya sp. A25]|nr:unnamed protein product [Amoebophrya sp. A25]|eukprot:GSA25T00019320001.1
MAKSAREVSRSKSPKMGSKSPKSQKAEREPSSSVISLVAGFLALIFLYPLSCLPRLLYFCFLYIFAPFLLCWVAYVVLIYPEKRVLHWLEFGTDDYAWTNPLTTAIEQDLLSFMFKEGMEQGLVDPEEKVVAELQRILGSTPKEPTQEQSSPVIVELAAGAGGGAVEWARKLREHAAKLGDGVSSSTTSKVHALLTDYRPNVVSWERHVQEHGADLVSYIPASIDAKNVPPISELLLQSTSSALLKDGSTSSSNNKNMNNAIRYINLALHHFEPEFVREMFADVIKSGESLMIGDFEPNRWNLGLNIFAPHAYVKKHSELHWDVVRDRFEKHFVLAGEKGVLNLVLAITDYVVKQVLVMLNDGTTSVLRVYSQDQLRALTDDIPGADKYEWKFYAGSSTLAWILGKEKDLWIFRTRACATSSSFRILGAEERAVTSNSIMKYLLEQVPGLGIFLKISSSRGEHERQRDSTTSLVFKTHIYVLNKLWFVIGQGPPCFTSTLLRLSKNLILK